MSVETQHIEVPLQEMVKYLDDNTGGDPWRAYVPEATLKAALEKAIVAYEKDKLVRLTKHLK